jgi:superfamily II DNA or RNA helicase
MHDWPHQTRGFLALLGAIKQGRRRIVLACPTGGGKSRIIEKLIRHFRSPEWDWNVSLYTNRRMLVDQISRGLMRAGIEFGVRAAGHEDNRHLPVQISSVQTEDRRVLAREEAGDPRAWALHPARLVVFDEGHLMTSGAAVELASRHLAADKFCVVIYFTATPLGMADVADVLIQAGTNSELRDCGALVPAHHYGPDEPDLRKIKLQPGEDPSEAELRKAISPVHLFGSVFDNWRRLNPEMKPTLLFAPGVAESRWFADEFNRRGVPAAHIDADYIRFPDREVEATRDSRQEVLDASRAGTVRVVCNRFVLREGIDAPWLAHGIFATVFGSVQSYLQAGGRLLRSSPGLDSVTIQDHGGNWWRLGSLNADRVWDLELTDRLAVSLRADRLRRGDADEVEPWRCGDCGLIVRGPRCPCGWESGRAVLTRQVMQTDGTLLEMVGRAFPERRVVQKHDTVKRWVQCYWRTYHSGGTFKQAVGLFVSENHYWPPEDLKMMPRGEIDWYRVVKDVDPARLRR